jgi:DUF1707 SHOCT-like domain
VTPLEIPNGGCYRPIDSRPARELSVTQVTSHQRLTLLPGYALGILRVGVVPVTAGPGGQGAADAAARAYLRASHADREQVIDVLKIAFAQGRLSKDELDARVGKALAAQTYAELAALTADLPAGLIAARRPGKPARAGARLPVRKVVAGAALIVPPPAMVAVTFLTGSDFLVGPTTLVVVFFFMAWIITGAQMFASWHDNRSRHGQLPPRPAPGGHVVEPGRDARPGNDLMLCQAHRDTRARRLLGHGVTQRIRRSVPTRPASTGLCT